MLTLVLGCYQTYLNDYFQVWPVPKEADYQKEWCQHRGGLVEYRLKDKTRVDCLTLTHAIEFDFANKWAESIGQFL